MLTREEIDWLKKSANELNNLLQEISASSYRIETLCSSRPDVRQYLAITVQSVDRASKVTSSILQRIRTSETLNASPRISEAASSDGEPSTKSSIDNTSSATQDDDPESVAREFHLAIANASGPKELIMMVDDENAVLMLAKMMLTDAGYRVLALSEPAKAYEIYKRIHSHIGLVILDFAMPIMDGGELFDNMRMVNPNVAAVLSSGFADQKKLSQMLSKGLKGFIPKPYTPDKLLTQIRSILDNSRRRVFQ